MFSRHAALSQKGKSGDDLTTLPRFFSASLHGKEEATRVASKQQGVCDLALTKRGVAIRSWSKDLKSLRLSVLSSDPRVTEDNAGVLPKYAYDNFGWPNSITPLQVVKSVTHATKCPPVLTKCYHSVGVTTRCLLFQDHPKTLKFSACFNTTTVGIILSPVHSVYK